MFVLVNLREAVLSSVFCMFPFVRWMGFWKVVFLGRIFLFVFFLGIFFLSIFTNNSTPVLLCNVHTFRKKQEWTNKDSKMWSIFLTLINSFVRVFLSYTHTKKWSRSYPFLFFNQNFSHNHFLPIIDSSVCSLDFTICSQFQYTTCVRLSSFSLHHGNPSFS